MKPTDLQYSYKKQIGFTETQRKSLANLERLGINVNQFIRQAVKEKLKKDWPQIREQKERIKMPF